ncbi:MAG: HEAT repeat domain-containing protein [Treponema sp.]|nr:HEAT repeat domain-containing protein [Treponema sp.]
MTDFFNSFQGGNIPAWVLGAIPVTVILLALLAYWFLRTRIFKMRLRRIITAQDAPHAADALRKFSEYYPPEKLVRYSRRMERYSRQWGPRVVRETGLADKWVQKLSHSPGSADIRRVLLYCHSSFAFKAFLAAGQHPTTRGTFFNWVQTEGEEKVIRLLADSCRGEDFDPAFCRSFLENQGALIRELTGEPEWYARYFAYRLLLLNKESLTERSLEDGLLDPHPIIRKILTEKFTADGDKTWAVLWDKLLHDPVYEVRKAAKKRIAKEFLDRYSLKNKFLSAVESMRVLELLDPESLEDRTFAISALESATKELRYPAAAFLEKTGVLASILGKNTLDDPSGIDHSVNLLYKALEVNISGFLRKYPPGDGAPLLVAARLLTGPGGTQESICYLEEKVFEFFSGRKPDSTNKEIYTKTLEAAAIRGGAKALELFAEELSRRENEPAFLELLLPRLPQKAETIFLPVLLRFLENPAFPEREELVNILGNANPDMILPMVFSILNTEYEENKHVIRISALKILGRLRLPFCLQRVLESLPIMKAEEAEEFASIITSYPQEVFEEKARTLLASPDSQIRAAIISILPATQNDSFVKEIRSSLKDVDPDVRVAAIKALLGYGEIRLLNQETSMLRDPVERVRLATAEVIARHGNAAAMEILKNIINDPYETEIVKMGVIAGLGQASAEGITILVDVLDSMNEFREHAEKALAMRTTKRDITQLIEIFKDAEPQLREKIIPVFKAQGRKAEPQILEILKDEVASFKPFLVKILEETGYVDEAKRRLLNRDIEVRREAALLLSLMDTLPAFRGLVLAAKDPDQEVRVCVVKALEKLKTSHGRDILEKLKDDPDSRIRKYTHWALERLDSLGME